MNINNLDMTNKILSKVSKLPTNIYGLNWKPTLEPHISDDTDWIGWISSPAPNRHFSELDHDVLRYAYHKLIETPKLIVEIGVDRSENFELSSTATLLKLKQKDCVYIGIDLEDKSSLNDVNNNVFTIKDDSANYKKLYDLMRVLGKTHIDMMFVDGWHSVNQVLKEWKYWEKMTPRGVMAFHDINYHPGPVTLVDAINTDIFSVELFGRGESDWGVGVVQRR